jgi:hypothetical protein
MTGVPLMEKQQQHHPSTYPIHPSIFVIFFTTLFSILSIIYELVGRIFFQLILNGGGSRPKASFQRTLWRGSLVSSPTAAVIARCHTGWKPMDNHSGFLHFFALFWFIIFFVCISFEDVDDRLWSKMLNESLS